MSAGQQQILIQTPAGPVANAYEHSRAELAVIVGPTGSGKTDTSAKRCARVAQWQEPSPLDGIRKARVTCVTPTYRHAWRSVIPSFQGVWEPYLQNKLASWNGSRGDPAEFLLRARVPGVGPIHLEVHFRAVDVPGVLSEDADGTATVDVWIDLSDLRIIRIGVEGEILLSDLGDQFPSQIGGGPASITATISLSDYGKPVTIDVPQVESVLVDGRLPGTKIEAQINLVIDFGLSHPAYKSTPATSGWHYGPPQAPTRWGVHDEFVSDEILLQNLVQGGVGLHYNCPDGCPEIVAVFTELAGRYAKIVVSPYPGMDTKISLTAWTFIDQMDELDLERIELFVRAHHDSERAPEYFKP